MKKHDAEFTTLQTLSTAVELGLNVITKVMGDRNSKALLSKAGRSGLAQQMQVDLQREFIKEIGAAQNANR